MYDRAYVESHPDCPVAVILRYEQDQERRRRSRKGNRGRVLLAGCLLRLAGCLMWTEGCARWVADRFQWVADRCGGRSR